MDSVFPLLVLATGFLALVFARNVANAMNFLAIVAQRGRPSQLWQEFAPPGPRKSFENWLWFIRFWAVCMMGLGLLHFAI
jgi:hypothetical protein